MHTWNISIYLSLHILLRDNKCQGRKYGVIRRIKRCVRTAIDYTLFMLSMERGK